MQLVMSGAGSYWEKINVPPIDWDHGAKWIKQGADSRDPGLYEIDLPGKIAAMQLRFMQATILSNGIEFAVEQCQCDNDSNSWCSQVVVCARARSY